MFATAGEVATWTISKYKLTSEDGDCYLASSKKSKEDYAISIANGNFTVDWNGNIHANTIYLGKKGGVLDGDENGKTVIKNINMVNNNGKGLNFDSNGNLLLDVGLKIGGDKIVLDGNTGKIKLMSGGKITCGDSDTGLSINGSYFEFDCPVKFSGATVEIPYSTRLLLFGGGVLNGTLTIKNQVVEWKDIHTRQVHVRLEDGGEAWITVFDGAIGPSCN